MKLRSRDILETPRPTSGYTLLVSEDALRIISNSGSGKRSASMILNQVADVDFPTCWARFRLLAFEARRYYDGTSPQERRESALALVLGDCQHSPLVRIHSQCITGEALHSLRCDCRDQLQLALSAIGKEGAGLLIYEQQEGRGIGLLEKLRAYQLQDQGLDTIDANLHLGHAVDSRDYALAVEVLRFLRIRSLRLISNNPHKVDAVACAGIQVAERVPADAPRNPHSSRYMDTKRERLGHFSASTFELPRVSNRPLDSFAGGEAGPEGQGASWQIS